MTGDFPAQRVSNAEMLSIWERLVAYILGIGTDLVSNNADYLIIAASQMDSEEQISVKLGSGYKSWCLVNQIIDPVVLNLKYTGKTR